MALPTGILLTQKLTV